MAEKSTESIGSRATRGTLLSVGTVIGMQVIRLAGNLITTRLLFPEAYGLMLLVLVLNQGLKMVSDVGILPNIIQHERGDEPDFLNTAWTLQVIRGIGLSLIAVAIAWPYAEFYEQPELFALVLFAATQGAISGFDSTKIATLNRKMQLGRLVFIQFAGQILALGTMIIWALLIPSVWALIGGAVVGDAVRMILSHVAIPGPRNRFKWDKTAVAVIFDFGKWIFVSTIVTYIGLRFDSMALGRLIDLDELGVYNIGQNLAALPIMITGRVAAWVLLPALSASYRENRETFTEKVKGARRTLSIAGVLMMVGTAAGAPAFFWLLYDARYVGAGWMVQLIMVPTWFFFLQETSLRIQLAMGDSKAQMWANIVKVAGTVPGALIGYALGELAGLILGVGVGSFIGYLAVAYGLKKKGMPIFVDDLRWTTTVAVLGLAASVTPWFVGPALGIEPQLASLFIAPPIVIPYAIWAARTIISARRSARQAPTDPTTSTSG